MLSLVKCCRLNGYSRNTETAIEPGAPAFGVALVDFRFNAFTEMPSIMAAPTLGLAKHTLFAFELTWRPYRRAFPIMSAIFQTINCNEIGSKIKYSTICSKTKMVRGSFAHWCAFGMILETAYSKIFLKSRGYDWCAHGKYHNHKGVFDSCYFLVKCFDIYRQGYWTIYFWVATLLYSLLTYSKDRTHHHYWSLCWSARPSPAAEDHASNTHIS